MSGGDHASIPQQDSRVIAKQKLDIGAETSIIMVNEELEAKNSVSITNRTKFCWVR